MEQRDWIKLLEKECKEKAKISNGYREIFQDEIVVKLRIEDKPKDLKKLSRIWLIELSDKAKQIQKYCKEEGIPIILTDSGDGIDIHIFTSNLKTIAKQILNDSKKITALPVIKMIIEQIIMVKAKIRDDISVEITQVKRSGEILAIGSMNPETNSFKTAITKLTEKKYTAKKDVIYPKKIVKWKMPDSYADEVRKILRAQQTQKSKSKYSSTPDYDLRTVEECFKFLGHKEETEVRLINPNRIGDVRSIFVHSKEELFEVISQWAGKGYNFYVGINERSKGGKKGIDVKSVKTVVIDIDAIRIDDKLSESERKKLPATKEELSLAEIKADTIIKREFLEKGFKKPVKAMSGNGWQLWAAIPEIKITDKNRDKINAQVQEFNRMIRDKYTDDTASIDNIGDLARVIKVIGTKSIKGKETEGFRPHRLTYSTEQLIRDEDSRLRDFIFSIPIRDAPKVRRSAVNQGEKAQLLTEKEAERVDTRIKKLCQKDSKLKKLLSGDLVNYSNRSDAEWCIMIKLIKCNFTKSEIFYIFANSGCTKWNEREDNYKNNTYDNALRKINEDPAGEKATRFLGMLLKDFNELRLITDLVKKSGHIPYDGTAKPHKTYHITLQPPKEKSREECMSILEKAYNFEMQAEVSGVRMFNNKIVLLLKNLKVVKGDYTATEPLEKYLAKNYKASFPFKPHITIAEGDREKIKLFYQKNKKSIEKETNGIVLRFQPVFITKNKGVNE